MDGVEELRWELERLRSDFDEKAEGGFPHAVRRHVTTATYTVQLRDEIIAVNYAGAVTVTLPNFGKVGRLDVFAYLLYVKDESGAAGTNNITIDGNGNDIIARANSADTIDVSVAAVGSVTINSDYGVYALYFNGTVWHTLRD